MSGNPNDETLRGRLLRIYSFVVSEVDPKNVFDLLIQKEVVSIELKEEMMTGNTTQERCRALLDWLLRCSNDDAFIVFREALRKNYHWIAKRLDVDATNCTTKRECGAVSDLVKRFDKHERHAEEVNAAREDNLKEEPVTPDTPVSHPGIQVQFSDDDDLVSRLTAAEKKIEDLESKVASHVQNSEILLKWISFLESSYGASFDAIERQLGLKRQTEIAETTAYESEEEEDDDYPDIGKLLLKPKEQSDEETTADDPDQVEDTDLYEEVGKGSRLKKQSDDTELNPDDQDEKEEDEEEEEDGYAEIGAGSILGEQLADGLDTEDDPYGAYNECENIGEGSKQKEKIENTSIYANVPVRKEAGSKAARQVDKSLFQTQEDLSPKYPLSTSSEDPPPLPPRHPSPTYTPNSDSVYSVPRHSPGVRWQDMEIKSSDIQLETLVETLQQTEIWSGKLKETMEVWVKKLTGQTETPEKFFREAHLLYRLSHPNVVRLLGFSSLIQPFYIVTECSPESSLLSFVQKDRTITLEFLIEKAMQIAKGMSYVAQKGIVHRDLRASNILLDAEKNAKVSNFYLAIEETEMGFPNSKEDFNFVERIAPESSEARNWISASDVWSYGILLYEIFSSGNIPDSGIDKKEILNKVQYNYHLPCPENGAVECPTEVYEIMLSCWNRKPEARPRFSKLQRNFQDFLHRLECFSRSDKKLELLKRPILLNKLKGSETVRGLAMMDNILYVARFGSKWIEKYRHNGERDFKMSKKPILLTQPGVKTGGGILGMINYYKSAADSSLVSRIQDMACCLATRRLFVCDEYANCVWCVDAGKGKVVGNWSVGDEEPHGISVTSSGEVVVIFGDSGNLGVYSSDGTHKRTVFLSMVEDGPWHAVVLDTGSFVITHGPHYIGPAYVSVVEPEGRYTENLANIQSPSHLTLLPNNYVLVAESANNCVVMFDQTLSDDRKREILNQDDGVVSPARLLYCEDSGQLIVGLFDGSILIYRIANV